MKLLKEFFDPVLYVWFLEKKKSYVYWEFCCVTKKSLMNKAGDRCRGFDLLLRKRMCCVEMFSEVTENKV